MGHSSGTLLDKAAGAYLTDSFRIGECKKDDPWLQCSGGCNDYELGGGCQEHKFVKCTAGQTVKITIYCSGNIT